LISVFLLSTPLHFLASLLQIVSLESVSSFLSIFCLFLLASLLDYRSDNGQSFSLHSSVAKELFPFVPELHEREGIGTVAVFEATGGEAKKKKKEKERKEKERERRRVILQRTGTR